MVEATFRNICFKPCRLWFLTGWPLLVKTKTNLSCKSVVHYCQRKGMKKMLIVWHWNTSLKGEQKKTIESSQQFWYQNSRPGIIIVLLLFLPSICQLSNNKNSWRLNFALWRPKIQQNSKLLSWALILLVNLLK